jgi:uncharacterized protein (DUF952 family)
MTAPYILHLTPAAVYNALAEGEPLRPASLAAEGFIHCTVETVVLLDIANRFYRDAPGDFLVLVIDREQVAAPVKFEAPIPPPLPEDPIAGHLFPHIYGPLNRDAIVAVRPARRRPDGTFVEV